MTSKVVIAITLEAGEAICVNSSIDNEADCFCRSFLAMTVNDLWD